VFWSARAEPTQLVRGIIDMPRCQSATAATRRERERDDETMEIALSRRKLLRMARMLHAAGVEHPGHADELEDGRRRVPI